MVMFPPPGETFNKTVTDYLGIKKESSPNISTTGCGLIVSVTNP